MAVETQKMEDFRLEEEPYYLPVGNEVELFEAAYEARTGEAIECYCLGIETLQVFKTFQRFGPAILRHQD